MKDIKLIQTLKTFTKDEIKNFEKLVASPFFNKGRNYLPLLYELQKFYPVFDDERLTSEYLYKKIYPGRKFNKQVMWNQVSGLEKLTREFLLQTALKNNRLEEFVLLFDELSKRHLHKQSLKEIEQIDKFSNSIGLGKKYFYTKWNIEDIRGDYWTELMDRSDKSFESNYKSAEYLLLNLLSDLSVVISNLQIARLMYNAGNEINSTIELIKNLDLKKLVDHAKKTNHKHAAVMSFYFNKIMCALNENDESYFFEMKKYFDENYNLFESLEQKNTVISLANYCAHKMRLGKREYFRILFEINRFRLEKGIDTYSNQKMEKSLYYQIFTNAASLGEIKWAEHFVEDYTSKLKKEHQKPMNALAWGYIHFTKKDYTKSLEYLNKVEFIDLRDKLHVRILSAKAFYELNNTESLFYYIDSSKHFIRNNIGLESVAKKSFMFFFNYLKKLLTYKEPPDKFKLNELRIDIDSDKNIMARHKNWLLEKIDMLLKIKNYK
ncbi:MAG: hypothetical protein M3R36_15005 [Bacteroidota bacterium]|nr:hypothetical protein [Bacteroidota bacterium]